jgi:alpha-1,3-rhamnosyl/mannosyltransferase
MPLIFVGDRGWESSSEHAEIRDLESRGWARYLNYVPNDQLIVLYQNAAALIFTSLYEGFGLPAAEAKACGCRVIASEGSAMSEFLSEDDIQVNPYAVEDIARAMQHILDSRAVCRAAHIRAKGPRRWREVALDMSRVYSGLGA